MTQTESTIHRTIFTGTNHTAISYLLHGLVDSVEEHLLDGRYFPVGKDLRQIAITQISPEGGSRILRYGIGEEIRWIVCRECKQADFLEWNQQKVEEIVESGLCLGCAHWMEMIDEPKGIRIGGVHYMVGDEHGSMSMRGHGGQRFDIWFYNGQRITTTDLWCQGTIPKHFRDRLPDNASFVTERGMTHLPPEYESVEEN